MKDFDALMWCFGYLRKHIDRGIKFYHDHTESPVYDICKNLNVPSDTLIGFSDSSWHDCIDTGRSTTGYKIFYRGTVIDSNSSMPIPVSMSTAEAEYMSAALCCMSLAHHKALLYDFEKLGDKDYDVNQETSDTPMVLLVDNKATVEMSKNYKETKKNRHIARRYHYVRQGTKMNMHKLLWIKAEDQLADDMTKSQTGSISLKHMKRTLFQIPDHVCGKEKLETNNMCKEQFPEYVNRVQEEYCDSTVMRAHHDSIGTHDPLGNECNCNI